MAQSSPSFSPVKEEEARVFPSPTPILEEDELQVEANKVIKV